MIDRVAVIGAGSWGTTVAALAARRAPTALWARRPELAEEITRHHRNTGYLPGVDLPDSLQSSASLAEVVAGADLIVMAVPSHGFRPVLRALGPQLAPRTPVLSLAKGLERGSHRRMTEVICEELPGHVAGVLSGPNLAREIAAGQPAATVVAMADEATATSVQQLLITDAFRVYTNPDVVGCEVAGATKNVLAIAAGMASGFGLGDSSLAALITRGLAELGRLVVAMGGERMTVAGLAGVGDLVATCTSGLSRNRRVGVELGRGRALADILDELHMVAEGVKSARPLVDMASGFGVEMPIAEQMADVLDGRQSPGDVIPALMARAAKSEFHGMPPAADGPPAAAPGP
ncbi:MAG TPA: NAD(P)H-dependent glycerol-3-phosphate dehydrogenase [Acidimicrobiales bacterium]|nr:NAD(P)H-dependent glycerol-3-phosphate dehydrogenase [Acidimicrobiales bacterium]